VKCPKCQSDNPDKKKFCGECGTQLIPSEEISAPTETLQAAKEELTTGSTFAGRYQIIEELGKGGMGKVYKALDTEIREKIALKLLNPEISSDRETIERFRNELKLARKIAHRNVCKMYDLGEEKGTRYISMEYVAGEDLKRFIRKVGQIPIPRTISIAKQVCEGLEEAHRLGVVHRDLKPQNIMVDEGGNARIMDFGIARSIRGKGITGAGVMIGTPEYMSPEQAEVKEVDQRSDIYSLGIILYEMVTGQVPFEGETPLGIAMKHKSEAPRHPNELNAQIPEDLSRLILKCLEKDKDKRYQSTGEVHSQLENIEKGIPTAERIVPKEKPLTTREITVTLRLKKLFIPALIVAAIAVVGIVIWQLLPQREPALATPDIPSIAVLPLVDLSPQKDQGYFCDGMTEAIIEKLSQLRGLKVSSRTSVMRYKNTDKDLTEISKELSVATILEGSVQREDDNIRIHAQLVNVADNFHVWSDHYDRKLTSVFAIQSDIAQQIARVLKARLTPEEEERLARKPTENLTAYDYYLKGRQYYVRYKKQDNENSIKLFKKALEFDPDFALAYAGLGDSYAQRTMKFDFPDQWYDAAIEASEKAIALSPDLSEGYKALGLAYMGKGWNRKAKRANQKAIELNQNNEQAVGNLGWCYLLLGEFDKAEPWFKKVLSISPTLPFSYYQMGVMYFSLDDYARAEQWLKKALELQPDFFLAISYLTEIYLIQGKYQKALEHSQKWLSLTPDSQSALVLAGRAELLSGNYELAEQHYQRAIEIRPTRENLTYQGYIYWKKELIDEARKLFTQSLALAENQLEQGDEIHWIPYNIATVNAIQGNKKDAYKWLQKAIDSGWRFFRRGLRDPLLENLREDEQFKQMMAQVKAMVDEMRQRIGVGPR